VLSIFFDSGKNTHVEKGDGETNFNAGTVVRAIFNHFKMVAGIYQVDFSLDKRIKNNSIE